MRRNLTFNANGDLQEGMQSLSIWAQTCHTLTSIAWRTQDQSALLIKPVWLSIWGVTCAGNYGPPPGFQWEWGTPEGNAEPFKDDPNLEEYNVDSRIEEFVEACRKLSNVTYGNDIMLTMGTDFTYSNAFVW